MNITACVKSGTNHHICDDTAFVGETIIDEGVSHFQIDEVGILGVADGVGGNLGGKEASRFVCQQFSQSVFEKDEKSIILTAKRINDELLEYANGIPGKEKMATTFTALLSIAGMHYLVHVGNTRLYVSRGKYLKQVSMDHTTRQWLVSQGKEYAADHCNSHEINSCFGGGNGLLLNCLLVEQVFSEGFPRLLVLTSDGVHEFIDIDKLEELVFSSQDDEDIIQNIITEAENNGSTDDKTVILMRE